jgi:hypothetical protein
MYQQKLLRLSCEDHISFAITKTFVYPHAYCIGDRSLIVVYI